MTVNLKEFEANTEDGYRPILFDVDIEGFPSFKYYVKGVKYRGSSQSISIDLIMKIVETESFYARNAFDKLLGKRLTLRAYKKNGDIAYREIRKITHLNYDGEFSWEQVDTIFEWTVGVMLSDKLED